MEEFFEPKESFRLWFVHTYLTPLDCFMLAGTSKRLRNIFYFLNGGNLLAQMTAHGFPMAAAVFHGHRALFYSFCASRKKELSLNAKKTILKAAARGGHVQLFEEIFDQIPRPVIWPWRMELLLEAAKAGHAEFLEHFNLDFSDRCDIFMAAAEAKQIRVMEWAAPVSEAAHIQVIMREPSLRNLSIELAREEDREDMVEQLEAIESAPKRLKIF